MLHLSPPLPSYFTEFYLVPLQYKVRVPIGDVLSHILSPSRPSFLFSFTDFFFVPAIEKKNYGSSFDTSKSKDSCTRQCGFLTISATLQTLFFSFYIMYKLDKNLTGLASTVRWTILHFCLLHEKGSWVVILEWNNKSQHLFPLIFKGCHYKMQLYCDSQFNLWKCKVFTPKKHLKG